MKMHEESSGIAAADKLQETMLAATPDCIKLITREGNLLDLNAAGKVALGLQECNVSGIPWIPLLPPSVHSAAWEALSQASEGKTANFSGYSEGGGSVIYWDNLLTPVTDESGYVTSIVCVSRNVTKQTLLQRDLDKALEREKLLSREMLHRINNIFSVVGAVVIMSEKEALAKNDTAGLVDIVTGKLSALSRSYQAVLAGADSKDVDLRSVADSVLKPFSAQCRISGPVQSIPHETCSALALCIHELATNAVKYGSLSTPQGEVMFSWSLEDGWLDVSWVEIGGPPISSTPERLGFGSKLIDRLGRSAGCSVSRKWLSEGLRVDFRFAITE